MLVVYLAAMLLAAVDGLQRPSLEALVPQVVAHDQLSAAAALTSMRWQLGMIVGPAVGGILLAAGGTAVAYGVDVATYAVSAALLFGMRRRRIDRGDDDDAPTLRHILEIGRAHV